LRTVFDAADKKIKQEMGELEKDLADLRELGQNPDLEGEIEEKIKELENRIKSKEFEAFLSGKYDKNSAILSIYSGAGGQDAQDWATMLLRMYQRYSDIKGFKTEVLSQSFGEGGGPEGRIGTKSVSLEVKGKYAYGYLKKESGVHRLVRISPFSQKKLRHTSFAQVEVLPEFGKEAEKEIIVSSQDLRVDTYRASGPGGQYVNKRESAIRITHLPTGLVVTCQSERLQGQNKERAMKMLMAKLYQLKELGQKEETRQLKGERQATAFGSQIRSYVLHPYKMVKDIRTKVETGQPEKVLDGYLESFIEAQIKLK